MTTTRTENPYPHLPEPAGAVKVFDWETSPGSDRPTHRYFVNAVRRAGQAEVLIEGTQWATGAVEGCLSLYGADADNMDTATARQLAAALIAAADEIYRLT